jgi:hypothetical protein
VVISYNDFARGKPASKARYHFPLADIQVATFIRYQNGPMKGKVDMITPDCLNLVAACGYDGTKDLQGAKCLLHRATCGRQP